MFFTTQSTVVLLFPFPYVPAVGRFYCIINILLNIYNYLNAFFFIERNLHLLLLIHFTSYLLFKVLQNNLSDFVLQTEFESLLHFIFFERYFRTRQQVYLEKRYRLSFLLFPIFTGRTSHGFGKYPAKIKWIFKSNEHADLIDFHIGKIEVMACFLYFEVDKIIK